MNRYEEITEWLKEYVPIYTWIYFNVNQAEDGAISVNSVQNESVLDEFIDGSRRVEFLFAVALAKAYDTGTSDNNLDAMEEFENIQIWIEKQNAIGNFPNFGDNIEIEKVEVLETVPSVSVDGNANIAKYQGQFKITYIQS